ncbi:UPF0415 protein C7orf25 [Rhynchospora pubera]|uniref:UPF0415 protein C7orf25 n=1 Tax=Rhynchospora pubera TaxID=906938 RepID=A0AAV8E8I2_9POAL|nr:UPF0415 protein C7orf25 [Rhynchospora pubera]
MVEYNQRILSPERDLMAPETLKPPVAAALCNSVPQNSPQLCSLARCDATVWSKFSFPYLHAATYISAMTTPPSPSPTEPHADDRTSLNIAISECHKLRELIHNSSKLFPDLRAPLVRQIQAELDHLSRRLQSPHSDSPLCSNLGYLSAVCHVIHHPSIQSVSGVSKHVGSKTESIHVDIMCSFRRDPAWVFVSDRNPSYVSWVGSPGGKDKGLRDRVETAIAAANEAGSHRPNKLLFVFARGLEEDVRNKFLHEFGAVESDFADGLEVVFDEMDDEWLGISDDSKRLLDYKAFEIQISGDPGENVTIDETMAQVELDLCSGFDLPSSKTSPGSDFLGNVINFDTTALIAMVSGISNGDAKQLLEAPPEKMREKYKSNYEFVIGQAKSELEQPMLEEVNAILAGKKGITCQSALEEFKELVSKCGGPAEKDRASKLLKSLIVVPDNPSQRVMNLQTTGKVDTKNKIIFGTGDRWHAPTLTAKKNVVRAIAQTGMSLLTVVHRPRALTGL